MSAPLPLGRTSCAAPSETPAVAAARVPLDTSNPHALPSDAPLHRHGRTRPDSLQTLRDLTRPAAASLLNCEHCGRDLTPCPMRGCGNRP